MIHLRHTVGVRLLAVRVTANIRIRLNGDNGIRRKTGDQKRDKENIIVLEGDNYFWGNNHNRPS